jgi:hypothetical protein
MTAHVASELLRILVRDHLLYLVHFLAQALELIGLAEHKVRVHQAEDRVICGQVNVVAFKSAKENRLITIELIQWWTFNVF